jgi:hypothetical protein
MTLLRTEFLIEGYLDNSAMSISSEVIISSQTHIFYEFSFNFD